MPLRWKKTTRCSRFSQLIADHIQSRRRGGSLVVQTGFPTSLIDLYVRNRGKLRNFSEKRQSGNDFSSTELNNSSSVDLDFRESDEIVEKGVGVDVDVMVGDLSEHFENSNWVLAAAMKLLLMAALALGTKRFTVGITLSAFLLHFLVFVGKSWLRRSRLSKPCLDPRNLFESFVHGTRKMRSSKATSTSVVRNQVLEIEEVVEDLKEEIIVETEPNEVRCEVLVGVMHKSSHRAKMKSKVLKLVPKKFRTSKKHCLDSKLEITCGFKEKDKNHGPKMLETSKKCCLDSKCEIPSGFKDEDTWDLPKKLPSSKKFCLDPKMKTPRVFKGENNTREHDSDLQSPSLSSALSSESLNEEQDKLVRIEISSTWSKENDHKLERKGPENSGYLVLCLIVLVGLIGGRVLSLVLAVSWCLMLANTQRRHVKLPIS